MKKKSNSVLFKTTLLYVQVCLQGEEPRVFKLQLSNTFWSQVVLTQGLQGSKNNNIQPINRKAIGIINSKCDVCTAINSAQPYTRTEKRKTLKKRERE